MRRPPARLALALAAAVVALLTVAAAALASETIGPEPANPNPSGAFAPSSPSGRLLFNDKAPAGTVLTTPSEGTITRWNFYTDEIGPEATAQLYALTSAGGEKYTVVAVGPKESLTPVTSAAAGKNALNSFAADLAVPAGSYLGVRVEYPGGSTVEPVFYYATGWDAGCLGDCAPVPPIGGTETAVGYAQEMAMNATFESASSGGGDTTPTCVGACGTPAPTTTPPPVTTPAPVKKPVKCKKGKRRVHGKCVKKKRPRHKKKSGKTA